MYADTEQAELATWEHDERVAAGMEPDRRAVAHLPLRWALSGEILGTYLLVLFGTGAVAAQVLTKAQIGLWQVAVVWGFGLTLAIYVSGALSSAQRPPASWASTSKP